MDELEAEVKETGSGFSHNRIFLLEAYGEGRMFGLQVLWTKEMEERGSEKDAIFLKEEKTWSRSKCMLPCFMVLDKPELDDDEAAGCDILWTAQRARCRGLASYILNEKYVRYANHPIPQAKAFWAKHFSRVQAELDEMD